MTNPTDKEWIERADKIVPMLGTEHTGRMLIVLRLARELQSSFDQGVERERAELHAVLDDLVDLAEGAMRAANNDGGEYDIDDLLSDARKILTPTPTEGEQPLPALPVCEVQPPPYPGASWCLDCGAWDDRSDGKSHHVGHRLTHLPSPQEEIDQLRDLVTCLLDNDPNEPAADGGVTVLDVWRQDARRVLGL